MLQLFRKNLFFTTFLIFPYAIVLHLGTWLGQFQEPSYESDWIYHQLFGSISWSVQSSFIVSSLLIAIQAIMINRIVIHLKLNPEGQLFAGIFFIILCGFHHSTLALSPILVANLFFCGALYSVFDIYIRKNVPFHLYNFGFMIGLASLFYVPYYIFIFFGVFALVILRGFVLREFFQILFGFFNVYFLVFVLFYVLNLNQVFMDTQIKSYFSPYMFSMDFTSKGWVAFGIIMILFIICLIQFSFFQIKRTINIQKYYDLIFWCLFISLFSLFFLKVVSVSHLLMFITPLSILLGLLITKIKNSLFEETLHLIFVLTALFLQFQNW